MSDLKIKYPSTSSTDLTISLASLASGSSGVFTAGQESTAVDNTSNVDLDHLLSGIITTGTSPTASRSINIYVYANISSASGTPTYPDVLDGTDSAETFTSANVMNAAVKFAAGIIVDNNSNRSYYFGPVSVASLFGGVLPKFWGVYIAHDTAVALNSTAGNHKISYERIQNQAV